MTHAASRHRELDRRFDNALAEDGAEPSHHHALLPSRLRARDARSMNGPPQARVLLAVLSECTSTRGTMYMRGWAGASNLVAFRGEPDEQGRPTWQLYLVERQPRDGSPTPRRPVVEREATSADHSSSHANAARRAARAMQE